MVDDAFAPSELGTKEYWDEAYGQEYDNFTSHGDVGEVWFGENVTRRILRWFRETDSGREPQTRSIIDLGCGNGILLQELSKVGYRDLTGVDYSAEAIRLATEVASSNLPHAAIRFQVGDILEVRESACAAFNKKYHVCTDKGTYDAISLDPDSAPDKRKTYIRNVSDLLVTSGKLVLTSCNWTKEELVEQFKEEFTVLEEIPMPQFTFGGKTGQKVTSLVFQKKADPRMD